MGDLTTKFITEAFTKQSKDSSRSNPTTTTLSQNNNQDNTNPLKNKRRQIKITTYKIMKM
jgi:hypothetical protein